MIIEIWTDGSGPRPVGRGAKCIGNGGWAAVLKIPGNPYITIRSGGERDTTISRMELTALISVLEEYGDAPREFVVHTDSTYLMDPLTIGWLDRWIRNGWLNGNGKQVANQDLWRRLDTMSRFHRLHFVKVKGHDKERRFKFNELADIEARKARDAVGKGH